MSTYPSLMERLPYLSSESFRLGACQIRLEKAMYISAAISEENLSQAESEIRDVDMAKEMMEQTKNSFPFKRYKKCWFKLTNNHNAFVTATILGTVVFFLYGDKYFKPYFFDQHQHWERFKRKYGRKIGPIVIKEVENFVIVGIQKRDLNFLFVKVATIFEKFLIVANAVFALLVP